jgi:hypothetical protein
MRGSWAKYSMKLVRWPPVGRLRSTDIRHPRTASHALPHHLIETTLAPFYPTRDTATAPSGREPSRWDEARPSAGPSGVSSAT